MDNQAWRTTPSLPSCFPSAHLPPRCGPRLWLLPTTTHLCPAGDSNPPSPNLILNEQIRVRHMDSQRILRGGAQVYSHSWLPCGQKTNQGRPVRDSVAQRTAERVCCLRAGPPEPGMRREQAARGRGCQGWACAEDAPPAGRAPGAGHAQRVHRLRAGLTS